MKYRRFRDHMGRIHRVRVKPEEIRERRTYWAVFFPACVAFGAVLTAVSGILG